MLLSTGSYQFGRHRCVRCATHRWASRGGTASSLRAETLCHLASVLSVPLVVLGQALAVTVRD